jgi:hypothetical protein
MEDAPEVPVAPKNHDVARGTETCMGYIIVAFV